MRIYRDRKGQAIVETALVLLILFMLLFAITEFARAWFTKNSLKNAVRQGARVAAVTPNVSDIPDTQCPTTEPCTHADPIIYAVCCQPGIPKKPENNTTVTLDVVERNGTPAIANDEIKISATSTFRFVIGGSPLPWAKSMPFNVSASMRYE